MFKKIFFIMAFFFLYISFAFSLNVKAKDDVMIVYLNLGCDHDLVTSIEDAIIISGDVDTGEIGEYEVTYFSTITKTYFKVKYIVVNDKEYENGITSLQVGKSVEYNHNEANYILKDGDSLVISSFRYSNASLNNFNDKIACLYVYKNNIEELAITYNFYSEIIKIVKTVSGFIAVMNYEYNGYTHIKLIEYNSDGDFLRMHEVASDKNDYAKDCFYDGDYLYLVMNSSSSVQPFVSLYGGISCAMIIKIDYHLFKAIDYIAFGNDVSNDILDCLFYDNYLYVLFKPFGSGEFLKKLSGSKFIVKFDKDLTKIGSVEVDNGDGYFGASIISDCIYLFLSESSRSNQLIIDCFNLDLKRLMKASYYLNLDKNDYIYKVKGLDYKSGNLVTLSVRNSDNGNKSLYLIGIIGDRFDYEIINKKMVSILDIVVDEDICILAYEEGSINIYNYYYLILDDKMLINGKEVNSLTVYDSYEEGHLYGANEKVVKVDTGSTSFYKKIKYNCPLEASVYSGETYEKRIEINANGTKFLNEEPIEDGYIIEKDGDYLLKIYGTSGEANYIEFKVAPISNVATSDLLENDSKVDIVNIKGDNYLLTTGKIEEVTIQDDSNDSYKSDIGLGIIITIFFIGGALIIPIRKKKVGNNG